MISAEKIELIRKEVEFTFTRSSGPGGQHVNKTNTRAELRFDIENSACFSEFQKSLIAQKLNNRINSQSQILVVAEQFRSQHQNKNAAFDKLIDLIGFALKQQKKRKPTSPSRASKLKRLDNKKKLSELKYLRKKIKPKQ